MPRPVLATLLATLLSLTAAAHAAAKEDVRATIDISNGALTAPPGTKIHIGWTLSSPPRWTDGAQPTADARRERFGASGLYVRLESKTGAAPTTAYGHGPTGRYSATATVPQGGIGAISLGLEGVRMVPGKPPQRADVFFPIDNDPFASAAANESGGAPPYLWIGWALLVGVALLIGARRARRQRVA